MTKKVLPFSMAVLAVTTFSLVATAQIKKGKTRPLTTKQLMSGLVQPNCKSLGGGLKEAPADDKAWETLATNAALLNEAGYVLMADGRCPDGDWAKAAKTLQDCSSATVTSRSSATGGWKSRTTTLRVSGS